MLLFPSRATVQDAQPYDDAAPRDFSQDVPAHFTVVDGQVMLERDAKLEPAEPNQIVMAGDRLRTTTGRTEILFPDGSTLQVDEDTEIDFLSDSLMRLLDGRVRFNIKRATDKLDYKIDTAPGHVEIRAAGDYRIGIGADKRGKPEVDLTVFRGTAELVNEHGRTSVRAGRHAVTSADTEPSLPYSFNSASEDEFDQWVQNLRDAQVVSATSPSAQNLPQEVSYYANTMDSYGSWGYEEPYGQVWYPTVAAGWYPYSQGRWGYSRHYSYTWLGLDHWAWPTYHYGSWGVSNAGWYWVPGYAYAPAWVTWGYAPGYVGWCPIGPRGGPVYDWNGWIGGRYPSQHRGPWTVMPAGSLGHNTWVSEKAIRPEAMPLNARAAFTERRGAPVPTGSAVARRDVGPIGSPTVPRGAANARTAATGTNVALTNATTAPSRGAAGNRSANQSSAALSGFPPAGRTAVAIPNATRDGGNSGAARAVPRGAVSPEPNGLPATRSSFPDATRSAPRAEIGNSSGRVDPRGSDGFPTSGAVRAVPRGLEGPTGAPAMRAEPGPNSGSGSSRSANRSSVDSSGVNGSRGADGSSGYRAVPQGLQSAPPVNRGRTIQAPPTTAAPPMAPASRSMPAMSGAMRSAPMVAAPPTSAPPQVVPRGHSVSPAAAPASAPPAAASAPPSRGAASSAATGGAASQGSATARRGRGGL